MCCTTLEHGGGALVKTDAFWNADQFVRRHGCKLCVGASHIGVGYSVADVQSGDVCVCLDHCPGGLKAEGRWKRNLIETTTLVGVDEINAGRLDFHKYFALANAGRVDILECQYLGSAVFIYSDRFHIENLNGRSINKPSKIEPLFNGPSINVPARMLYLRIRRC